MNKLFTKIIALLLMTAGVMLSSCTKEEDNFVKVNIKVTPAIEGTLSLESLEGMQVEFTEIRSQEVSAAVLDNQGTAEIELFISTYDISIEETIKNAEGNDVVVSMRLENVSVNTEGQAIEGKVNSLPQNALGTNFIFSEIFFNGERNSGKMMHPDQYIVVFNPTTETLYADGLSIAVTHHLAWQDPQMWYNEYYPTDVPVGGFITVPGSGSDHAVAPGERFVIAFTAIDHSKVEGYDHAVDLTGADFEVFYGAEAKDVDNPEVENVLLTENGDSYGFFLQPRGYVSPLMFKLNDGRPETIEAFVKTNTSRSKTLVPGDEEKGTKDEIVEIDILSVPTVDIIDGVQTSDIPQDVKTRVIPESVDRGKFLVNGCHRQELAIRKTIKVGDKTFYQDTNNSTKDFERQNGQNSFPKGWRDNK